jgi:hypothetical protein
LDIHCAFRRPTLFGIFCATFNRPKGEERIAQGFSPGNDTPNEFALKGRPNPD